MTLRLTSPGWDAMTDEDEYKVCVHTAFAPHFEKVDWVAVYYYQLNPIHNPQIVSSLNVDVGAPPIAVDRRRQVSRLFAVLRESEWMDCQDLATRNRTRSWRLSTHWPKNKSEKNYNPLPILEGQCARSDGWLSPIGSRHRGLCYSA